MPYAWSLRPGAIIYNSATSGRGLEVRSAAGGGLSGTALYANNTSPGGIALWAQNDSATSTDATLVVSNDGTGPLIKGFGGDGGEDEFRVGNNGAISTKADSYIAVPGTEATLNATTTGAELKYSLTGEVTVDPSTSGTKLIQFGVVLPSVLYGQPVKVEEVTVFYKTTNARSYIDGTYVYRQKASDPFAFYTLVQDMMNRNSTTVASYSVTPTGDNTLSASEGFIAVRLDLYFADAGDSIFIYGIRVRLGHHPLY